MQDYGDLKTLDGDLQIEQCELYRPKGFTTVSLAQNSELGRLCAIRKLDQSTKGTRLFFLEFYNTMNTPHVVLEWKYWSQKEAFENVIWFGKSVVVGCSDGSLLMMSPFKCKPNRFPICASSIVASVVVSATQIAVASESSELKLLDFVDNSEFIVKKIIKFESQQRVVSLAASLQFSCIAVGMIDSIVLIQIPSGEQTVIKVSQSGKKSTIIWTVSFMDDFLVSGDSRGKLAIYNPKNAALVKLISSHQADIQAISYDGLTLVAAGTDYRIQVIRQCRSANKKLEWNTVGQRIFHENDVRCITNIGEWIVSGGAEHRIFISGPSLFIFNAVQKPSCSVSEDGQFIMIPGLDCVKIWKRPAENAETSNYSSYSVFTAESGPKLVASVIYDKYVIILKAIISPNARYLVSLTTLGLFIHKITIPDGEKPKVHKPYCISSVETGLITSFYSTNSALYFAHGNCTLERLTYDDLNREIIAVRRSKNMITEMVVDSTESYCLVMTARSEFLFLNLIKNDNDEEERFEKLKFIDVVPSFFDLHVTENGNPMAVLIISGFLPSIRFIDLKTKEDAKPAIDLKKLISVGSIISSVSKIVNNKIVLSESGGKFCVIDRLNEVQSVVFSSRGSNRYKKKKVFGKKRGKASKGNEDSLNNDEKMEVDEIDSEEELQEFFEAEHLSTPTDYVSQSKYKSMLPPFPVEYHLAPTESGKVAIVKITSEPESPPTCVPINIRRFNR